MSADLEPRRPLPELPYDAWEPTKTTLHLFAQIVGKVRLALTPPRNHWWHVTLYVTPRGLTTGAVPKGDGTCFAIDLDLLDGAALVVDEAGPERRIPLAGTSVAAFHRQLLEALAAGGARPAIRGVPYDLPVATPFAADEEHAAWDADAVRRFFHVLEWCQPVFWAFNAPFVGKLSPVHLFWHSFDLAVTRFSGRPAPPRPDANAVEREAYTHEVVSFGFWPGDARFREPAFYSYTAPEPAGLRDEALRPAAAGWVDQGSSSLAVYRYEDLRREPRPAAALLAFLDSAYRAGARRAGWDPALVRSA